MKELWNIGAAIECALLIVGVFTRDTNLVVCACTYILMWQNQLLHDKER